MLQSEWQDLQEDEIPVVAQPQSAPAQAYPQDSAESQLYQKQLQQLELVYLLLGQQEMETWESFEWNSQTQD